jgi:hypothetical protein
MYVIHVCDPHLIFYVHKLHTTFILYIGNYNFAMISHRESYVFEDRCRLCADESPSYVERLNTNVCPDCYSWAQESVGIGNLGIRVLDE